MNTNEMINMEMRKFNTKHKLVRIYQIRGMEYGINWSALGTVNLTEVKFFRKELREAVKIVTKINR